MRSLAKQLVAFSAVALAFACSEGASDSPRSSDGGSSTGGLAGTGASGGNTASGGTNAAGSSGTSSGIGGASSGGMASGGASSGGAAGSSFDGGGYPSTGGTTPGSGGGSGSSGGASTGGTGSGGSPPANGCGQEPPCSRGATCCISGYSETASRCRPAAECTGAVRRSCSGHSECPGQRCCLSGAVVVRDILTNPVTDGDLKCQPACGSGEAPVECLNAGQCGQGQQCCVYSSGNPLAATTILRSECAAVCQGGRAICRSDAECAQGQTCDGISVMVGAHFCTD